MDENVTVEWDIFHQLAFVRYKGEQIGIINNLFQAKSYSMRMYGGIASEPYSPPLASQEAAVKYLLEKWTNRKEASNDHSYH